MAGKKVFIGFNDLTEPLETTAKDAAENFTLEAKLGERAMGRWGERGCWMDIEDYELVEAVKEIMREAL